MPAEDTFLLRDAALAEVKADDTVLEMGTGSGEVASAVMTKAARTLACDINPHAVAYAHEVHGLDTVRSDMFSAISGTFSLILFNAPYLPTDPAERMDDWLEYALDGGADGCESVARFLAQAPYHLSEGGRILLLISSLTGLDTVREMAEKNGCSASVVASEREDDGEYLYVLKIVKN
ncbi:MAG TPA: 50S ribosomal protein L11 methyltransferase [Methanocorpusculum sp.]|nr:50S ribosomal protein L11 methyltransferase [Methanocorpusculum sp.]